MKYLLFLLPIALLVFSCQDNGTTDGMQVSKLGTRYELHPENGSGDTVATGQFVYFHAVMRSEGDSIFFDTRDGTEKNMPVIQAADMSTPKEKVGPVEDVLRYMREGDKATVRVNLNQFPQTPPGLEKDSVILYDLEVVEILTQEEFNQRREAEMAEVEAKAKVIREREPEVRALAEEILAKYKKGTLENVETTPSGLKYYIHKAGTGDEAEVGKNVIVQYLGMLVSDGSIFDQSFERGTGIPFPLGAGRVIPGWDEGIDLLSEGAQAFLFIPSQLGYGEQGTPGGDIPGGAELMFYVELEEVN